MKQFFTFALSVFFCTTLFSQAFWERTSGPQGFTTRSLQYSAQGVLYATGADKTTYRSDDSGLHWKEIKGPNSSSTIRNLEVGFHGTLFCLNDDYSKLYRSTDLGESWELAPNIFQYPVVYTEAADGALLQSVDGTIIRTYDGVVWDTILQIAPPWGMRYFEELRWQTDGNIVAVSNDAGIFISPDNGVSWDTLPGKCRIEQLAPLGNGQYVYLNKDDYKLFLAQINTAMASPINIPYAFQPSSNYQSTLSFLVTPDGDLVVANLYETLVSMDKGLTWQPYGGNINYCLSTQLLPGGFLLTGGYSFLNTPSRSTDLGKTWKFSGYGVEKNWVFDWTFKGADKIFAFSPDGLWRSLDAGAHWELAPGDSVLSFPRKGNYNIALAPDGDLYVLRPYLLLHTSDDGETIDRMVIDSATGNFSRVAVHPQSGYVYLMGDSGILRSMDHGTTWQLINKEDHRTLWPIKFHPSGTFFHIGGGSLSRSDDGGLSWQKIILNPQYNHPDNLEIAPDGKIVATNNGHLYTSFDNGFTWQKRNIPFLYYVLRLNNAGHAYFCDINEKKVLKTENDGLTWQTLPLLPSSLYTGIVDIAFDNDQRLWVCTDGDGYFKTVAKTVAAETPAAQVTSLELFPNPATNGFWIKNMESLLGQKVQVVLKDVNGKEACRQTITDTTAFVFTPNLTPGFYVVELRGAGRLLGVGKLMLR